MVYIVDAKVILPAYNSPTPVTGHACFPNRGTVYAYAEWWLKYAQNEEADQVEVSVVCEVQS
jgi:hypothetical protein